MCTQLRILRTVNYAPAYYTLNINVLKTDLFCAALKQPMSVCISRVPLVVMYYYLSYCEYSLCLIIL